MAETYARILYKKLRCVGSILFAFLTILSIISLSTWNVVAASTNVLQPQRSHSFLLLYEMLLRRF